MRERTECVLLSAGLLSALWSASLAHPAPNDRFEFADYDEATDLWPAFESGDLFGHDPFRVRAGHLSGACEFVAAELVLYVRRPIDALPVTALLSFISSSSRLHAMQCARRSRSRSRCKTPAPQWSA